MIHEERLMFNEGGTGEGNNAEDIMLTKESYTFPFLLFLRQSEKVLGRCWLVHFAVFFKVRWRYGRSPKKKVFLWHCYNLELCSSINWHSRSTDDGQSKILWKRIWEISISCRKTEFYMIQDSMDYPQIFWRGTKPGSNDYWTHVTCLLERSGCLLNVT